MIVKIEGQDIEHLFQIICEEEKLLNEMVLHVQAESPAAFLNLGQVIAENRKIKELLQTCVTRHQDMVLT